MSQFEPEWWELRIEGLKAENQRLMQANGELRAVARTVLLWCEQGVVRTQAPYEGNEAGLALMARAALERDAELKGTQP